MNAFNKVFTKMQGGLVDGHALRCIENNRTLAIAKKEITKMIKKMK